MCTVTRAGQSGLLAFLGRFRRRYALLTGLALSLAAVCVLSQFVLTVEVAGNQRVPTAVILSELRRQGLRPGGLRSRPGRGRHQHPRPAPAAGAVLDERKSLRHPGPGAGAGGHPQAGGGGPEPDGRRGGQGRRHRHAHGHPLRGGPGKGGGTPCWRGRPSSRAAWCWTPPSTASCPTWAPCGVRAEGSIRARTWRTLEAALPLEAQVKDYTGAEQSRWSVSFLGRSFVFCGNGGISFDKYDKISQVWELVLPGGLEMPLAVRRETFREYAAAPAAVDREAARPCWRSACWRPWRQRWGRARSSSRPI